MMLGKELSGSRLDSLEHVCCLSGPVLLHIYTYIYIHVYIHKHIYIHRRILGEELSGGSLDSLEHASGLGGPVLLQQPFLRPLPQRLRFALVLHTCE